MKKVSTFVVAVAMVGFVVAVSVQPAAEKDLLLVEVEGLLKAVCDEIA